MFELNVGEMMGNCIGSNLFWVEYYARNLVKGQFDKCDERFNET